MSESPTRRASTTTQERQVLGALAVVVGILAIGTLGAAYFRTANSAADTEVAVLGVSTEPVAETSPTTTATTSTSTSTTTTEAPPPPRRTAQLAFTGDTLSHRGVVRQAAQNASEIDTEYDFAPMFDLVRDTLSSADIAICHLETPLSPDNTRLSGYPTFNVPRELADGLAQVGYDGCTFASNHSLDRRPEGVDATLTVLDEAGLLHSGGARNQTEYDEVTLYDAGGIVVASLSYSYGFNGFREPTDMPWLVNEIDLDEISDEVDRALEAGAEYVALSLHWGTEYRHQPNDYQLEHARLAAAIEGVDIVIGHHAHVVQPVDIVDGTPVVYGLGNFLSNQSINCCAAGAPDGVIMQVNIQELPEDEGPGFRTWLTYVPTRVDRSDYTIVPVVDALEVEGLSAMSPAELEASRARTADALTLLGDAARLVEAACQTC